MNEAIPSMKIKRSKSPQQPLDQNHLDSIATLNDKVIWDALKDKDISTCFSLLGQLEHQIKNGKYGTYSTSRKHQHYHMFVCEHNLALAHQQNSDNQEARVHLQRAIGHYQKMQGFITNREENLVFNGQIAKLQLQYCGILSHCDMHQQAAGLAEKSLDKIIQVSHILQAVCYEQTLFNAQRQTTCSSRQKGCRNQFVDFKSIVIEQAEAMLQELSHLPPTHKLLSQDKPYYQEIISRIFAWKQNETNNEAAIRKQLKATPVFSTNKSGRSILGLQKQTSQAEYQIGTFMTLNFQTIAYNPHADPLRLLSSHYLRQLAFHCAVAYFTMATENRFSQPDLSQIRGSMKINQKYEKLNHDERMLNCKILHLKALEVAGRLLPSGNSIFSHLANSFCRNYKFVMDEIREVSEANSTHLIDKNNIHNVKPAKEDICVEGEYGIRVTPTRIVRKGDHSKLDKSKSKKNDHTVRRSKSQNRMRSFSGKKKPN